MVIFSKTCEVMKLRLLLVGLLLPLCMAAQSPAGVWDGTLSVNAARLRLVFRIAASAEGYTATLDSPDQGVRGIPVDSVDFRDGALSLRIVPLDVSFRGNLLSEGMLLGEFTQSGQRTMLMLSRRKAAARPQTPQPPFPYACREVRFPSRAEGVELAGTLMLPDSLPPRAAVVLVTGSGLQNRDEELGQTSQEELPARLPELKASLAADPGVQVLPVPLCENLLQVLDGAAASPWVCRFLTLDPSEAIRQAGNRPVLAVNGSLDSQVDPDENLAAIRQLLGDSGLLTVKEYHGLNHLLQPCETGDVSEYEAIEVTVSEEVLADLVAWLRALGR